MEGQIESGIAGPAKWPRSTLDSYQRAIDVHLQQWLHDIIDLSRQVRDKRYVEFELLDLVVRADLLVFEGYVAVVDANVGDRELERLGGRTGAGGCARDEQVGEVETAIGLADHVDRRFIQRDFLDYRFDPKERAPPHFQVEMREPRQRLLLAVTFDPKVIDLQPKRVRVEANRADGYRPTEAGCDLAGQYAAKHVRHHEKSADGEEQQEHENRDADPAAAGRFGQLGRTIRDHRSALQIDVVGVGH